MLELKKETVMHSLKSCLFCLALVAVLPCALMAQLKDLNENEGYLSQTAHSYVSLVAPSLELQDSDLSSEEWEGILPPSQDNSHPLYRSMDVGNNTVIAHSKYGNVTSHDLYLWLTVSQSSVPADVIHQYNQLKTTAEREQLAPLIEKSINDYIWVNKVIPTIPLKPLNQYEEKLYQLRSRVFALPGVQLVYMLRVIKPDIKVTDTDRLHALGQNVMQLTSGESWNVRYIFMKSQRDDPATSLTVTREKFENLRNDLISGKISFADAARRYSEAPSAENGGAVPPFFRGQYFFAFENSVADLQPGQLSNIFEGPGGLYLTQLLKVNPSHPASMSDPETAAKVEDIVMTAAMRSQFKEQVRLLNEKDPIGNMWSHWDDSSIDDVIGYVTGVEITRGEVMQLLPIEDMRDIKLRDAMLKNFLEGYLERENISKALDKAGHSCDADLLKVRKMAENMARRAAIQDQFTCQLDTREQTVRAFYNSRKDLFRPMPLKRLVRLTLVPVNIAPTDNATMEEMKRIIEGRPREPEAVLTMPTWDSDLNLDAVSTTVVTALKDKPTSEPAVTEKDNKETAVPAATATVKAEQTSNGTTTKTVKEEVEEPETTNTEKTVKEDAPDVGTTNSATAVKAENSDPVTTSGAIVETLGGADGAPCTVSCMPQYRKIAPTRLRGLVSTYKSSDWLLRYDDYGYVYLEDLKKIPKDVASLSVGSYSIPQYVGSAVVTYYLEDERSWPMQRFEEVKAYAYDVYRRAKVDEKLHAMKTRALAGAGISYSF